MIRILFIYLFLFSAAFGQQPVVESNTTEKDFPTVRLQISVRNPVAKPNSFFKIKEGDSILPVTILNVEKSTHEKEKRNILILVENLNHPTREAFYKQVLTECISQIDLEKYEVNIAVFDRVRNQGTQPISILLHQYTANREELLQAISQIKPKNDIFGNNLSADLYHAIYAGLENLNTNFDQNNNLIILSTGFNNKWSSHTSSESVKEFAQEHDIPIYSLQYRIQGFEHHKLTDVSHANFGNEMVTNSPTVATQYLKTTFTEILNNSGNNYLLQFSSSYPPNGKTHTSYLVAGDSKYPFSISTPNKNKSLYIVLGTLLFLLPILIVIFYLRNKNKKMKAEKKELEGKILSEKKHVLNIQESLDSQSEKLDALQQKQENKRAAAEARDKEEELIREMKIYGQLPFLQISILKGEQQQMGAFPIKKPEIKIGRSPVNDLHLDDPSVSRNHAKLYFDMDGYYIIDLDSMAGTKVNGERTGKVKLTHGAIITMGNTQLTFIL